MLTALPPRLYADLIGKPFLYKARGPNAYDCWGLLQEVLHRWGKNPTDFPSDPLLLAQALEDEWDAVEHPEPGDGILIRSASVEYEWHVGLVVAPGCMLHAREITGVVVERYDAAQYSRRIRGFYRFRGRRA